MKNRHFLFNFLHKNTVTSKELDSKQSLQVIHKKYLLTDKLNTIIYCDPGIDDALMLAQSLSSPKLNILAIIPGAGNVCLEYTTKNTLKICELTARQDVAVYAGSAHPINQTKDIIENVKTQTHGVDGLGGIIFPKIQMKIKGKNGAMMAAKEITECKDQITLLSTGPLTDVYLTLKFVLDENPLFLKNISAISIMAGVIDKKQANAPRHLAPENRVSEFNIYFDPFAANEVFNICEKYNIPIFLSPLDLTHKILFTGERIDKIKQIGNPVTTAIASLISQVPSSYLQQFGPGEDGNGMRPGHDVNASTALLHPEIYTIKQVNLGCVTEPGPELGKLYIHQGIQPGNVFVLDICPEMIPVFFNQFSDDMHQFNVNQPHHNKEKNKQITC